MGKITGIAHIALTVNDMEKSLDFYTRVLGFKKAFQLADQKTGKPWIEHLYIAGGQFIELFYGGTKDNPWSGDLRGFNHVCLQVDDIHSFVAHLEKEGVEIPNRPRQGSDSNWHVWVNDPDGIRVEITQINTQSPQYKIIQESV